MKLTVGKRLYLGFGIIALMLLALGAVTFNSMSGIETNVGTDIDREATLSDLATEIQVLAGDARVEDLQFTFLNEEIGVKEATKLYYNDFQSNIDKAQKLIKEAQDIAIEKRDLDDLKEIDTLLAEHEDELNNVISLIEDGEVLEDEAEKLLDQLEDDILATESLELLSNMLAVREGEKDFLEDEISENIIAAVAELRQDLGDDRITVVGAKSRDNLDADAVAYLAASTALDHNDDVVDEEVARFEVIADTALLRAE